MDIKLIYRHRQVTYCTVWYGDSSSAPLPLSSTSTLPQPYLSPNAASWQLCFALVCSVWFSSVRFGSVRLGSVQFSLRPFPDISDCALLPHFSTVAAAATAGVACVDRCKAMRTAGPPPAFAAAKIANERTNERTDERTNKRCTKTSCTIFCFRFFSEAPGGAETLTT